MTKTGLLGHLSRVRGVVGQHLYRLRAARCLKWRPPRQFYSPLTQHSLDSEREASKPDTTPTIVALKCIVALFPTVCPLFTVHEAQRRRL
ncbi:hypothetical protein OH77DRAFT_497388 [Trametes cingulata]|nr:hypothetical protein OH77DRAFT_497388 [Trametes cingulata]